MKTALFVLLDQYADWEAAYLMTTLNQDENWMVKTISIQKNITSIGGLKASVDYTVEEDLDRIDLLILVGGNSWNVEHDSLKKLIAKSFDNKISVGAICGAVDYLAKNGFLTEYKHTGNAQFLWNDFELYTNRNEFIETQVVRDRNLITANGTAPLEFTEAVLKTINFDIDEEIEKSIYMKKFGFYAYCDKYGNPFF